MAMLITTTTGIEGGTVTEYLGADAVAPPAPRCG
jgi:hypothetical protein